jgi:hypothetical protein
MGAMPNKTDRNDARGIAQIMRVSRGASEEPVLPIVACAAGGTADGAQQAARR